MLKIDSIRKILLTGRTSMYVNTKTHSADRVYGSPVRGGESAVGLTAAVKKSYGSNTIKSNISEQIGILKVLL